MAQARIATRADDYSQWYQDVISHAELAEAAGVVKGCMVIRPHGYAIWESIQEDLNRRFKATGHKNAAFYACEQVFELHHARVYEHQRWVVARHQRARRDDLVSLFFKIVQEGRADII